MFHKRTPGGVHETYVILSQKYKKEAMFLTSYGGGFNRVQCHIMDMCIVSNVIA